MGITVTTPFTVPGALPGWHTIVAGGKSILVAPGIDPAAPLSPLPHPFRLKILHLNDLHGQVVHLARHGHEPVFARIAGRLSHLRQRYARDGQTAVLFLSAGDEVAGSVFDELLDTQAGAVHASYRLYRAAGLDAAALGNHDFDIGVDRLAQAIAREAAFPVLSANIQTPPALAGLVHAAALFDLKGLRIGLIGLTTPAQNSCPDVSFSDPLTAVHTLLPILRPACHVLILLSHLGYSLESDTAGVALAGDVELAQRLPPGSVDLIVGGHTHLSLNEHGLSRRHVVQGVPIVQAGSFGRFLGEVTLTGQESMVVTDARLTPTAILPVDADFAETAVAPLVAQIQPHFTRPLGRAMNHPDLSPEAVFNEFAAGESALANFITAGIVARARAHGLPVDFAMIDASVVRAGLPAGDLTFADWFALMPYADTLRLCQLSGWQVWALLQDNARRVDLPHEHHVERGFLHFSGQLRYRLRLGHRREENQAEEVLLHGKPLLAQLDDSFTAVAPSFWRQLARPWEEYARAEGLPLLERAALHFNDTGLFLRRELVAYVTAMGGVLAEGGAVRDGRVQILPVAQPVPAPALQTRPLSLQQNQPQPFL